MNLFHRRAECCRDISSEVV